MMLQCCIYLALIDIVGTLSTSGIKNQSYFILSYTVCTHLNFKGFLEDKICFFKLETWIRQPPDFGHRPRPGGPDQRKQLSAACCNKEKKIQNFKTPVFFHNLKGFDGHLVIQGLKNNTLGSHVLAYFFLLAGV